MELKPKQNPAFKYINEHIKSQYKSIDELLKDYHKIYNQLITSEAKYRKQFWENYHNLEQQTSAIDKFKKQSKIYYDLQYFLDALYNKIKILRRKEGTEILEELNVLFSELKNKFNEFIIKETNSKPNEYIVNKLTEDFTKHLIKNYNYKKYNINITEEMTEDIKQYMINNYSSLTSKLDNFHFMQNYELIDLLISKYDLPSDLDNEITLDNIYLDNVILEKKLISINKIKHATEEGINDAIELINSEIFIKEKVYDNAYIDDLIKLKKMLLEYAEEKEYKINNTNLPDTKPDEMKINILIDHIKKNIDLDEKTIKNNIIKNYEFILKISSFELNEIGLDNLKKYNNTIYSFNSDNISYKNQNTKTYIWATEEYIEQNLAKANEIIEESKPKDLSFRNDSRYKKESIELQALIEYAKRNSRFIEPKNEELINTIATEFTKNYYQKEEKIECKEKLINYISQNYFEIMNNCELKTEEIKNILKNKNMPKEIFINEDFIFAGSGYNDSKENMKVLYGTEESCSRNLKALFKEIMNANEYDIENKKNCINKINEIMIYSVHKKYDLMETYEKYINKLNYTRRLS